ncbi:MAG: MFS transporter [Desulfobacterales bacterium SG8_35_2]|nr:MAG: MFS transporter [Desulfobacterales bacterium SG8_35_2]
MTTSETENIPDYDKKKVVSWALYDWGNSAFATTVMAGFFPIFFKQYWSAGSSAVESTFRLGAANSIASLIIVVVAPLLGAIADKGNAKKRFLLFFAFMGILMTGALFFVKEGNWVVASLIYVLGIIGFSGSIVFYDSLLVFVVGPKKVDFVSALGFALGYLGGGLLFGFNVFMTQNPEVFGLSGPAEAIRYSFISVALWWAIFSIPVMVFVEENQERRKPLKLNMIRKGFSQLVHTFDEIRKLKLVFTFLLGYWLYIDGVDTIVRMAVDYGLAIGFKAEGLVLALLITQLVGFPSAIAFGKIGEKLGPKAGIFIGIGVYIIITIWAYFISREIEFYMLAAGIGLVQGGVQSLSRSLYARIIPKNKSAEFFGFYNMLGKFAAVIGPVFMGWVGVVSGNSRAGILSLIVLFVAGAIFLARVDVEEGIRIAKELEQFHK